MNVSSTAREEQGLGPDSGSCVLFQFDEQAEFQRFKSGAHDPCPSEGIGEKYPAALFLLLMDPVSCRCSPRPVGERFSV